MDAVTHLAPTVGVVAACDSSAVARASFYRQRPVFGPSASPAPEPALPQSGRLPPAPSVRPNAPVCWPSSMKSDSRTALRQPCRPPSWTKASISARFAPCTASWNRRENLASAAISSCIRLTKNRSCWPPAPTSFGVGTSPSCAVRSSGPTSISTSSSTSSAATSPAGWSRTRESAELAKQFIEETIGKHQIPAGQLTIHADRGRVMTSKPVAFLMADLGVTKTHSRPYVSDDNPYSESQFRTMKYRPEFPDRFGCIQDSRAFCQQFFQWYNEEHRHSGIGLAHPCRGSFRRSSKLRWTTRQVVLDAAYQAHPDRFVRRPPKPLPLPSEVWINKPVPRPAKRQRKVVSKFPCRVSQSA